MTDSIKQLHDIISGSNDIVFFGGAGVSTESGIPDFRSADGIYNSGGGASKLYPPETILSHSFFLEHTAEFYEFYRAKLLHQDAMPNKAHIALAQLEQRGKLKAVVTQNIDGLHHKAGSVNVLELHGSCERNYCMDCGANFPMNDILKSSGTPRCPCGGLIKPDVVLFEEMLDTQIMEKAVHAIRNAEVLIIGGTSLNVFPAASLIRYYKGAALILINKSTTSYDKLANIVIHESIGETLSLAAGD